MMSEKNFLYIIEILGFVSLMFKVIFRTNNAIQINGMKSDSTINFNLITKII